MKRDDLIARLAKGLEPVKPPLRTSSVACFWLLFAWAGVIAVTWATGPMRPGFAGQLAASPRFAAESLLAFALGAAAIHAALDLGIPGRSAQLRADFPAFALLVAWIAVMVYGLYDPALTPSRLGKRPHCFLEGLAFSVPPLLIAFAFLRRRVALQAARASLAAGIASASLPALIMSFACMYDPRHILTMHIGVIPWIAVVAVVAGRRIFRRPAARAPRA